VVKLGTQVDYQGIIASSEDKVGKAIGYLTKYLAKFIADAYGDDDRSPRHRRCTWTVCTARSAGCPARRPARTGSASASSRSALMLACGRAGVAPRLTITWASVGVGFSSVDRQDPHRAQVRSRGCGPADPGSCWRRDARLRSLLGICRR
jgi:hypothetical protein